MIQWWHSLYLIVNSGWDVKDVNYICISFVLKLMFNLAILEINVLWNCVHLFHVHFCRDVYPFHILCIPFHDNQLSLIEKFLGKFEGYIQLHYFECKSMGLVKPLLDWISNDHAEATIILFFSKQMEKQKNKAENKTSERRKARYTQYFIFGNAKLPIVMSFRKLSHGAFSQLSYESTTCPSIMNSICILDWNWICCQKSTKNEI